MRNRFIWSVAGVLLLIALFSPASRAQETYCYRLTGIYSGGAKTAPNTVSRLFVTFSKNVCYDSDKDGFVGPYGTLRRMSEDGESVRYSGNCYFGQSDYVVSKSKDLINIWASDGKVYIYTRETPPSHVTQSSYGNLVCRYTPEKPSAPAATPSYVPTYPSSHEESSSSARRSHSSDETDCPNCYGSGKCSYCAGRGWRIVGDSVQDCIICHGSGRCPSCHGKGKIRY